MVLDETRYRISRKVQAHLALLPRPTVLRELSQHILKICGQGASTEEVILLLDKMLCHVEKPGGATQPYRTATRASVANPKTCGFFVRERALSRKE